MRLAKPIPCVALASSLLLCACGAPTLVSLIGTAGIPITSTPPSTIPLEVQTRGTGVPDPLPVRGSHFVYGDLEAALAHAVSSACVPWADTHRDKRPEGYSLFVELIKADAEHQSQRTIVTFGARATLRTRQGRFYLAQTQAYCREAGLVEPEQAAPIIYMCMTRLGRDLAGWLGSVEP